MNDLTESVKKNIVAKSIELKNITEEIGKLECYKNTLETQIKTYYEFYDIKEDEIEGVKLVNVGVDKKIPLKRLLDVFPNYDIRTILENVVCNIDIDIVATELNFKYSDFQDSIIKAIIKQLSKLSTEMVKKVVIKW